MLNTIIPVPPLMWTFYMADLCKRITSTYLQAMKVGGHQYLDKDGINVYIFSPEGEVVTFENFRTNKYVRKFERRLRPIRKFFNFLRGRDAILGNLSILFFPNGRLFDTYYV
jgi:hypothetical protein